MRMRNGARIIGLDILHKHGFALCLWHEGSDHAEYVTWRVEVDGDEVYSFNGHYYPFNDEGWDMAKRNYNSRRNWEPIS